VRPDIACRVTDEVVVARVGGPSGPRVGPLRPFGQNGAKPVCHETSFGGRHLPSNPYLSLIPWVVFGLIENRTGYSPEWAALGALVAAVVIAAPSFARGSPKLLDIAAIIIFVGLAIAAFSLGPAHSQVIADYGRAIAVGALSLFVFITLPVMPFTEQYGRHTVPRQYWDSPLFKQTNRVFSAAWGLAFAAMAVSHLIAGTDASNHRLGLFFNWLIPIGIIVFMVKFMARYREQHAPSPLAGGGGQPQ
jgi:hypothetical protein